jgi:hypothetical protein
LCFKPNGGNRDAAGANRQPVKPVLPKAVGDGPALQWVGGNGGPCGRFPVYRIPYDPVNRPGCLRHGGCGNHRKHKKDQEPMHKINGQRCPENKQI